MPCPGSLHVVAYLISILTAKLFMKASQKFVLHELYRSLLIKYTTLNFIDPQGPYHYYEIPVQHEHAWKQDHVEFNYLIYRIFFKTELTIPMSTYAAAVMLRILLCTVCREEGGHCTQVADATNIFIFLDFH